MIPDPARAQKEKDKALARSDHPSVTSGPVQRGDQRGEIETEEDGGFSSIWSEMQEVHERGLRAFAYWMHCHWKMEASRDRWERENQDPYPGDDYVNAYNAGVEAALSAVDFYIEESNR